MTTSQKAKGLTLGVWEHLPTFVFLIKLNDIQMKFTELKAQRQQIKSDTSKHSLTRQGCAMSVADTIRNIAQGNFKPIENMYFDPEDVDEEEPEVRNMDTFEKIEYYRSHSDTLNNIVATINDNLTNDLNIQAKNDDLNDEKAEVKDEVK